MTLSEGLAVFLKLRRIVAVVSILAGAGTYKFGPTVWHHIEAHTSAKALAKTGSSTNSTAASGTAIVTGVVTNSSGVKLSSCDLGMVMLTNHYETCVMLGPGRDCRLTPVMIDSHSMQLTVTVESKKPNGRVHDLSVTQVTGKAGEPVEVAVGDFSFSLTPNVKTE